MSILLLSCIRGIRNGKGLLIRAGVCIPNAAPGQGSGAVGQSMGLGQLPFYLSFASVSLPDPLLPHPLAAPLLRDRSHPAQVSGASPRPALP